tara:strand:+ start:55 stop:399 length:345 start_codon:yes stop_codon:yes gene_type:complete
MQFQTDLRGAKLVSQNDSMLARRISEFHIFGIDIVLLCLAIAILAQKDYVQNTKITVAETNAKAFGLWFDELKTRSKKTQKDKDQKSELFARLHASQCFLKDQYYKENSAIWLI